MKIGFWVELPLVVICLIVLPFFLIEEAIKR